MRNVTQPDENRDAVEDNSAALLSGENSGQNVATDETESDDKDLLTLEAILGERDLIDMIDNDPQTLLDSMQKFGQDNVVKAVMASANLHGNPVLIKQKMQDMIDHARATLPAQKTNAAFVAVRSFAPVHAPAQKIAANSEVEYVVEDHIEDVVELVTEEITETVFEIETEEFTIESLVETPEVLEETIEEPIKEYGEVLSVSLPAPLKETSDATPQQVVADKKEVIFTSQKDILSDILSPEDTFIILSVTATPVATKAPVVANVQNIVTPTVMIDQTQDTSSENTADNIVAVIAKALVSETNTITAPEKTTPVQTFIDSSVKTDRVETPVTVQAGQPSEEIILTDLTQNNVLDQIVVEAPMAVPQKMIAETIVQIAVETTTVEATPQPEEQTFVQDIFTPEDAIRIMTDVNSFVEQQARKQKETAPALVVPAVPVSVPVSPVATDVTVVQTVENPVMNMARETSDIITSQEVPSAEKAKVSASISMHEMKREMAETVEKKIDAALNTIIHEALKDVVLVKVPDTATHTLADIITSPVENQKPEALEETIRKSVSYSAIDAKASPRFNEFRQSAVMKLTPQTPVLVEEKEYPAPSYGQKEDAGYDQPVLSASYIDPVAAFANLYGYAAPQPTNEARVVPLNTPTYLKNTA